MFSRNNKITIVIFIGLVLLVIPIFNHTIVPPWTFRLIDESGQPVSGVRVQQSWKDYSLEFWKGADHTDDSIVSDSDGTVVLPPRTIRVSMFELIAAQIRNVVASINPHSSFGSQSYIFCRGTESCYAFFSSGDSPPESVVIQSKETNKKILDSITR
jgi:hypothetical protein